MRSLTLMSASDTGDEGPLVQLLSSVRNSDSASAPASRTVSVSNAASRVRTSGAKVSSCRLSALASAKRQTLDAQRWRIDAVTEHQIVGGDHRFEDVEEMPGDGHLAHRIGDLAVLDPESGRPAAVVAGHAVDAGADQVGDVKSLLDIRYQFGRRGLARLEVKVIG